MNSYIPIIYDAVVVFVIISSVIFSYKTGFLRNILSVVSYSVSFLIANFLGKFISEIIFDSFVKSKIENDVFNTLINSSNSGNIMNGINKMSNIVPEWLNSYLTNGKTIKDVASDFIARNDLNSASNAITNQIFRPYLIMIISSILFFILFIIIKILFKYIYRATSVVERLPVISTLNGLLGSVCGAVKAAILLFTIAAIVSVIILITKNELNFMNTNIINETNLFFVFFKIASFIK